MVYRSGGTEGDAGDLGQAFQDLAPWLLRTLSSRFGKSRQDAEDLVQETFLRLRRYDAASWSRHPKALLLRIAGNLARDAFRRDRVRSAVSAASSATGAIREPCEPADQHAIVTLRNAILALPAGQKEVFLLARFSPMTNAEIAAHLGISVKTVEWRLAKAVAFCLDRISN